ncbi:polyribonucleotide nucleotidyltransferase [Candidatus Berkelbacteria bacterium CG_4_8_14_3_um_filter_33_6]|uniref:Polyribonucleotide nucleotidyltransferase n=1 Tax=Candidatus Berkelbacteria bacterium CG_4_10_14_0_2_um_filter_35_9_33_12 TaxID=1974499 RepID=A0A2M7W454_9BACT|nr:MAG: polyribonucleotide nucleotidyltransferase [Candidatus Berkelbacteria bacterium CG23_combo_of_CG06-09_8_20_14_all_33_15]PIX30964.1 MAG: polyribonucleotide nucleotidyltransferase [Candidatus Berkelbacteria bacterium CG_4_8_14_3_um_filter_33_6]PJA20414.1 MAG: polyribonucleotide nucleotidyltransferase [Candidatus Berkelbacteria bacterium CG_4_10_14_0_2_um_filter_35_9_33_12]
MIKKVKSVKTKFGDNNLILETGKIANLATASVVATWGETVVLSTVTVNLETNDDINYLPLQVEYEERFYATGKISGSHFIKREGKPSDKAVLSARQIDRPIRPLFPKSLRNEIQIVVTVLSYDGIHNTAVLGTIATSAALMQTSLPFEGPIGSARVAKIDGKIVVCPDDSQVANCDMDILVAATRDRIMMLEIEGKEANEKEVVEGIKLAHSEIKKILDIQTQLEKKAEFILETKDELIEMEKEIKDFLGKKLEAVMTEKDKNKREVKLNEFEQSVLDNFEGNYKQINLKESFSKLVEKEIRKTILTKGVRPDGRKLDEIRPIDIEVGLLPRTHGSGLFSRGQTQSLSIVTLGAPGDEQTIETMEEEGTKRYMHHYNFPPFSTGEIRQMRSTSRREIGHGVLAEKALIPVLPSKQNFPYTIRVVSEIMASNGSSSMAATCGSTLALLDAGVPLSKPVAGIAIGLITPEDFKAKPGDDFIILTDIAGIEDFAGDMDFKVAGTKDGITAVQMDTKLKGLTYPIIEKAFKAAKKARLELIEKIKAVIPNHRSELSPYAPRIEKMIIDPTRIAELIGPGGKTIRKIVEDAGGKEMISIDIDDSGLVMITSNSPKASQYAKTTIENLLKTVEVGEIYEVVISDILKDRNSGVEIGAIADVLPGKSGMIHISEIANFRVPSVSSQLRIGQTVKVKVVGVDKERGRIALSIKQVAEKV